MKLLTINLGLLDYSVCGMTLFSNPPFANLRLPVMPAAIIKINADIVAIQECYADEHFYFLLNSLHHLYPHHARKDGKIGCFNLHNGLLILSKFEITDVELFGHDKVMCIEDWFGDKSTLIAHIHIPNYGRYAIINTHPTAGGTEPESEKADLGREHALQQTLNAAKRCHKDGILPILIGDFNCAPDCSQRNYEQIINAGYRDCFVEAMENKTMPECPLHTWDPFNILNATGPHAHCPPARLDHVFVPKSEPKFGQVRHCNVVFHEKIVEIPVVNKITDEKSAFCTLSDHYGVVVDIDLL